MKAENLLDAALALAALGLPVFPCATNKRPCCEGGFNAASTDPAEIARMFADPRAALIGVPTGAVSGFDALDIDPAKGGQEWRNVNAHRLPRTRRHFTRSGGTHELFPHTPGLRNSASKIAPGVDIRADGGYIIWWPQQGFATDGSAWEPIPDWLLIEGMRRQHREGSAPAPTELAPPSAADLVALLNAMPNPESTTRDDYVALNLAVQGCLRALDALGQDDANAAEDIRDAAADWSSRWDSDRASDYETELRRWDSDWSIRTNDVSGWRHVLNVAHQCGADTSPWRHAAAVAEFGALPAEPAAAAAPAATAVTEPPAAEPAASGADPYWESKLLMSGNRPKPTLGNVLRALRDAPDWQNVFRYNTFSNRILISRQPPFDGGKPAPREISDTDFTRVADWMEGRGMAGVSKHMATDAVAAVADDNRFSPLVDYLDSLAHDGAARIDGWLIDHFGAADTPLHRAFSARFLISAVARAYRPGCQVDTMLVLEGLQGIGKSSALRAMFSGPWFTDHIPDLHNKDAALQIQGIWCLEHAEMATLNRTDANRAKEFISRREDRFRAPFGRTTENHPRQCVFAATVNPNGSGYLKDETGARRFWPVLCGVTWPDGGRIDIPALAAIRDQLWAEAVARYRAGEPWWLDTRELEQAQAETADARYDADAWTDAVREFIADKPFVWMADIFAAIGIPLPERSRAQQMRLAGVLRALDWHVKVQKLNGTSTRTYVPRVAAARQQPPQHQVSALRGELAPLAL